MKARPAKTNSELAASIMAPVLDVAARRLIQVLDEIDRTRSLQEAPDPTPADTDTPRVYEDAMAQEATEPTREQTVDRFGWIDEASGHEPLRFGRTNNVQPHGISGEEYVRYSDYLAALQPSHEATGDVKELAALLRRVEGSKRRLCLDAAMMIEYQHRALTARPAQQAGEWWDIASIPDNVHECWVGHPCGWMAPAMKVGDGWRHLYTREPIAWKPRLWAPLPSSPSTDGGA